MSDDFPGNDPSKPSEGNRAVRRAMRKEGKLDSAAFLRVADAFIDVANRENRTVLATDLHLAFLFASARYSAHVAKVVQNVDAHEPFVEHMTKQYQEMLRQHLADQSIAPPESD